MTVKPGMTRTREKQARALYEDGYGCNAIARQIGVAPATVSKWAKDNRLPFDRRQSALAVRAHTIDLRLEAQLLAQKLIVAAHDTIDALDGQYTLRELGRGEGKDAADEWHELVIDEAPVEVRQKAMVSAAVAIDKALKVSDALSDGGEAETKSMLRRLGEELGIVQPDAS